MTYLWEERFLPLAGDTGRVSAILFYETCMDFAGMPYKRRWHSVIWHFYK